ncbi:MAG: GNAT family N-acetyltransferase [Anaerolineaceae bacterium]|nr:GNAT family N-acetyltransferase [Anaerolineaceae bacterium]
MTLKPEIRHATAVDAPVIARHRRRMFEDMGHEYGKHTEIDTLYQAWVAPRLEDGRYVGWLMQIGDQVVGGAGVEVRDRAPHPYDLTTRYAYVVNVYVEPEHRRQGFARQIVNTLLEWCKQQDFGIISLHASDEGRPLYQSLGFAASNEMQFVTWQDNGH